ncbi:MAG: helix-turn-helix domain-containing protein [Gammaproteobacteria bacterium]|nr:helix-turn-helix domain-containing protein [Gammaproteobacteria bacterium]
MNNKTKSPAAITEELGERLKQARLNTDMTQTEVADLAGVSRKVVLNAEKGKVQLESLVAIMVALNLTEQLGRLLPKQDISPIQLSKLHGKKRQRASGQRKVKDEEPPKW